jgi:N-acetylglucosamine repressor
LKKATAQQHKEHNQRLVLSAIYSGRANHRAQIAQDTHLTRPTVSQIVRELMETGYVVEEGPGKSRGGRRPTLLEFVDDARAVIGLSVQEDVTLGVVTDLRGRVLARVSRPTDHTEAQHVLEGLCAVLDNLRPQLASPLLGIGISIPGLVLAESGYVRYSDFLGLRDVSLREIVQAHCGNGIPVYVDNDTNLAALGEWAFGGQKDTDNLAFVLADIGIGAGFVINRRIYHGARGATGEIGHMPVAGDDVRCVCGHRGCLQAVVGKQAFLERAAEAAASRPQSALAQLASQGMTLDRVRQAAEAGDLTAWGLVQDAGVHLGLAISMLVSVLNPQRIVIGGELIGLGTLFFESLERTLAEHTLALLVEETEIVPSRLGADASILGAAAQVLRGELGVI